MGIIANDSIKIEGISEKFDLRNLYIKVVPNEHAIAELSIRVKDEGKPADVIKSVKDKLITIKSTEADNSGILFKGYVSECTIHTVKSSGVVNLELISTSIKLDEEYEYESYQKEGDTFGSILKDTAAKSKGTNSHCDSALSSLKLEKPIIQYKETNWEFIKRIASRKRLPVIVDETADKPAFIIGYKKEGSASEKDFEKAGAVEFFRGKEYCERKFNEKNSKVSRKDYCGMELRSFKNLKIGSSISIGGSSYMICSKQVKMKNAQLEFIYEAGTEKLYGLEPIYNEHLRGRCLEGKVVKTRNEYIKLQLELDEKKPESELYEFKWKPETGNLMYTMPEENTVVSLYIGGSDEGDAIVINALRKDDGKDTNNPDNKYYTTAKGKRMYLKEKEVGFSNDAKDEGGTYINMKDAEGITFSTAKQIYVEADGDVNITSGGKIKIEGSKMVQLDKGSTGLVIKQKVEVIGTKASFDFGVAAPEQVEKAEKTQISSVGDTDKAADISEVAINVSSSSVGRDVPTTSKQTKMASTNAGGVSQTPTGDKAKNDKYTTKISPQMEKKILEGQRKSANKNEVIGGHSSQINNGNDLFVVEELSVNADGTRNIKFVKDLQDGNISKIKKSTVFPDSWSDSKIIESIKDVGDSTTIAVRGRDGATWHRKIIDGVEIDVIKLGDDVVSGYPTGKVNAPKPSGF